MSLAKLPAVGSTFPSVQEGAKAVRLAVAQAQESLELPTKYNNRVRWAASCKDPSCAFSVRIRKKVDGRAHVIESRGHTCSRLTHVNSKQVTSREALIETVKPYLRHRPCAKQAELENWVFMMTGVKPHYKQLRRATLEATAALTINKSCPLPPTGSDMVPMPTESALPIRLTPLR